MRTYLFDFQTIVQFSLFAKLYLGLRLSIQQKGLSSISFWFLISFMICELENAMKLAIYTKPGKYSVPLSNGKHKAKKKKKLSSVQFVLEINFPAVHSLHGLELCLPLDLSFNKENIRKHKASMKLLSWDKSCSSTLMIRALRMWGLRAALLVRSLNQCCPA